MVNGSLSQAANLMMNDAQPGTLDAAAAMTENPSPKSQWVGFYHLAKGHASFLTQTHISRPLVAGITHVVLTRPKDPVDALGRFLIEFDAKARAEAEAANMARAMREAQQMDVRLMREMSLRFKRNGWEVAQREAAEAQAAAAGKVAQEEEEGRRRRVEAEQAAAQARRAATVEEEARRREVVAAAELEAAARRAVEEETRRRKQDEQAAAAMAATAAVAPITETISSDDDKTRERTTPPAGTEMIDHPHGPMSPDVGVSSSAYWQPQGGGDGIIDQQFDSESREMLANLTASQANLARLLLDEEQHADSSALQQDEEDGETAGVPVIDETFIAQEVLFEKPEPATVIADEAQAGTSEVPEADLFAVAAATIETIESQLVAPSDQPPPPAVAQGSGEDDIIDDDEDDVAQVIFNADGGGAPVEIAADVPADATENLGDQAVVMEDDADDVAVTLAIAAQEPPAIDGEEAVVTGDDHPTTTTLDIAPESQEDVVEEEAAAVPSETAAPADEAEEEEVLPQPEESEQ